MAKIKETDELILKACEAYGIDPKYVFSSAVKDGEAVILTNGGTRVRYRAGDKGEPLKEIAITGINPEAKRKVIAGAPKK
jgi:hypothetical protein